jgi:hypothetical protein
MEQGRQTWEGPAFKEDCQRARRDLGRAALWVPSRGQEAGQRSSSLKVKSKRVPVLQVLHLSRFCALSPLGECSHAEEAAAKEKGADQTDMGWGGGYLLIRVGSCSLGFEMFL